MTRNTRELTIAAAAAAALAGPMTTRAFAALGTIPAFPGAQGPGANATGGRGGDVYHVSNLEFDSAGTIPGSLKYGIVNAPSAGRTIVFDVGGTIYQNGGGANSWFRSSKSNITIAGQTAPGPGITIAGVGTKFTGDSVVLRNITVRTNKDPVNPTSFTYDAFSSQLTNSIIDHVSASWFTDEGISQTDAGHNTTVQYALMGEGLNYNGHSYGSIIATEVNGANLSYHHNLYAHNNSRMPRLGSENGVNANLNFSNNVIYNWQNKAGYSGTDQFSSNNFIDNYFIKGNNNGITAFDGGDVSSTSGHTKIFQNKNDPAIANKYDYNKNGVFDGAAFGPGDVQPGTSNKYYAGDMTWVGTPFAIPGVASPDTADVGRDRVLNYGGANWANRNPIEQRIVQSARNGTGNLINDLTGGTQAAEWATVMSQQASGGVAPFNHPAGYDTDQDGMPNAWEQAHGLNPGAASHNGDFDADEYTNIEEYINELGEWPAPKPLIFTGATNARYEQITNWDITWQPSKYDEAQVSTGTVTIDSVGQHARDLKIATNVGNVATFAVSGGWIDIDRDLLVGPAGTGNVMQTGGMLIADRAIVVGKPGSGSTSNYTLAGGSLVTPTIQLVGGGSMNLTPGGNKLLATGSLSIDTANNSKLDLADNDALLVATPRAQVEGYVASARTGGTWTGPGVTSSTAATNASTGLAVVSGDEYLSFGNTTFNGVNVAATNVVVKYTWNGDADVNGVVNFDDYVRTDVGFNTGLTGWSNGDFNYSGSVNFDDYVLIDVAFNTQSGTLGRAVQYLTGEDRSGSGLAEIGVEKMIEHFGQFGHSYAQAFLAAVPEPNLPILLAGLAASAATRVRRRRRN